MMIYEPTESEIFHYGGVRHSHLYNRNDQSLSAAVAGGYRRGLGMRLGAMGGSEKPTAKDYVQSGLVAMWDGIENADWGVHDYNSYAPIELKNGIVTSASASQFEQKMKGNFWQPSLTGIIDYILPSSVVTAIRSGIATVESCFTPIILSGQGNGAWPAVFGVDSVEQEKGFFIFCYNGIVFPSCYSVSVSINTSSGNPIYYSSTRSSDGISRFYNSGNLIVERSSTAVTGRNGIVRFGRVNNIHTQCSKSKMYSVRIYNRQLSEREISHNYSIDKVRFGLT